MLTFDIPQDFIDGKLCIKFSDFETANAFIEYCQMQGLNTKPQITTPWIHSRIANNRTGYLCYTKQPFEDAVRIVGLNNIDPQRYSSIYIEELIVQASNCDDILDLL